MLLLTRFAKCAGRGSTKKVSSDVLIMPDYWNEKGKCYFSFKVVMIQDCGGFFELA